MFQNYSVRSNKASTLFSNANHKKLASIQGKQEKELFKLQKFKNVDPRTNTNLMRGKAWVDYRRAQGPPGAEVSAYAQE